MNAVATTAAKPPGVLASIAGRYQMDPDAFKATVKGTVFPGAGSNEELAAFLVVANEYRLNPLTREIYAFPKQGGGIVPIVSIDGWISLVNSHPKFKGMEFEAHLSDKGVLVAYTCRIWRNDRDMPTVITEYLEECIRQTAPWKMRHRMLRHKALIQCARYAFGFSGIYDEDEGSIIADVREVAQSRRPPAAPRVEQIEHQSTAQGAEHGLDNGEIDAGAQQETQREPEKAKPVETKQEPKPAAKATPKAAPKVEQQQDQQQPADNYDPAPILAKIQSIFDECDSEERLEIAREKLALPLYERLSRSDQEAAKHIYNLAQGRIETANAQAQMDAGNLADPVGPDERDPPADDTFPGDLPSKASAGAAKAPTEMTPAEYEAYAKAYIEAATDGAALKKLWFGEAEVREAIGVEDSVRKALRSLFTDKTNALRDAEG